MEKVSGSLNDEANYVSSEWCEDHPFGDSYVTEVFPDHVIVCSSDNTYWSISYTKDDSNDVVWDQASATEVEQNWVPATKMFEVKKIDEAKQLVFGWASVAKDAAGADVEDSEHDFISPDDLENAAYEFTLNYREGDEMHTEDVKAHLVESMMFTPEKCEKLGLPADALPTAWWTGFYIPDAEVFAKVKDGEYQAFSIGGVAHREPVSA